MTTLIFGRVGSGYQPLRADRAALSLSYVDPKGISEYSDDKVSLFCATVGKDPSPKYPVEVTERLVVAADAYLTNKNELCAHLRIAAESSPAKIISKIYEIEGQSGLDRLDGDYAFCLFDRPKNLIICRRDPFGVRPFFYSYRKGKVFAFASVPDHLIESGIVSGRADPDGLVQHLHRFGTHDGRTLIRGIRRLDPATQLLADSNGLSFRRYWVPGNSATEVPTTFESWCEGLKKRFQSAVAKRLPEKGVLAAQMSGGLDSTGVVVTAAKLFKDENQYITTFTKQASDIARAKFGSTIDETEIAEQVAATSNRISSEAVPGEAESIVAPGEPTPTILSPGVNTFDEESIRRAANNGADVILTGWGGDNVVTYSGWGVAATLLRQGKWRHLWRLEQHERRLGRRPMRQIAGAVITAYLPKRWRERIFSWRHDMPGYSDIARDTSGSRKSLWRKYKSHDSRVGDTKKDRLQRLLHPVLALKIETLALIGLKYGVRPVHPMLDRELVEYALNCPPEFEFRRDRYRAPFREIMGDDLPDVCGEGVVFELDEFVWQISRSKSDLLGELDRLKGDRRLHEYFDFSYTRRRLMELPDEDDAASWVSQIAKTRKAIWKRRWVNHAYFAVRQMQSMQNLLDRSAE